ncbi:unnamed protein product [Phytophthora fragariaefolia]|uniref:Unnamed protein product n=1 Tax=Phytophthora fragariaefolia TaxID=1490495 RepID=A0A9W6TJE1_9STRA|nr:unnamed protein product [Phytophthora fragariaefolia]
MKRAKGSSVADGYGFGDVLDASDEAKVSAGRSGTPRPITRNLAGEFDEVAKPEPTRDVSGSDNDVSGKKPADEPVVRKLPRNLPPINSSTPAANRVIGRILDQMMESTIGGEELKQWKRKLRLSFGTSDFGLKTPPTAQPKANVDPSQIPLPQTPKKSGNGKESDDDGVFGVKTEVTPYFQVSHMVTPRSSNRADRLARDTESSNAQKGGARASSGRSRRRFVPRDDSSDDEDDYYRKEDADTTIQATI